MCPYLNSLFPFYSLLGAIMHFSLERNVVLIENDNCIEGITDDRCAIIVFVTVLAQSLLVSCSDVIHLRF